MVKSVLHAEEEEVKNNRKTVLLSGRQQHTDDVNDILARIDCSIDIGRDRYDPILLPGFLDYKIIELLMEMGPLRVLRSDVRYQKTSDNRQFLNNIISESFRLERLCKGIVNLPNFYSVATEGKLVKESTLVNG